MGHLVDGFNAEKGRRKSAKSYLKKIKAIHKILIKSADDFLQDGSYTISNLKGARVAIKNQMDMISKNEENFVELINQIGNIDIMIRLLEGIVKEDKTATVLLSNPTTSAESYLKINSDLAIKSGDIIYCYEITSSLTDEKMSRDKKKLKRLRQMLDGCNFRYIFVRPDKWDRGIALREV